jgi:large subunit ribosomal protein L16
MLAPKNLKYRKPHQCISKSPASSGTSLAFGEYGIQSLESSPCTSRQIESSRRVLSRYVRRTGKLWIRIFPDKIITKRPAETRIGSGKGSLAYWVSILRPGQVVFEFCGVSEPTARQAARITSSKLPFRVRFLIRTNHSPTTTTAVSSYEKHLLIDFN